MICPALTTPKYIPLDLSNLGPYIFINTSNLKKCMMMSHLPKLIHQKYNKCYIYTNKNIDHVVKSVFTNNPYVTSFITTKLIDMPPIMTFPDKYYSQQLANIYGFNQNTNYKPELYLNPSEFESTLYDEIFKDTKTYYIFLLIKYIVPNPINKKQFCEIITSIKSHFLIKNINIEFVQAGTCNYDLLNNNIRILQIHNQIRALMHIINKCNLYIGNVSTGIFYIALALEKPIIIVEKNHYNLPANIYPINTQYYQLDINSFDCTCGFKTINYTELQNIIINKINSDLNLL
jgi:hypothetical protein